MMDAWRSVEDDDDDAWLCRLLHNPKNQRMISRLEDTLEEFLQTTTQTILPFPPRTPFHRRVCLAVARRFHLDHRLDSSQDSEAVCLVLVKTSLSCAPAARLASVVTHGGGGNGGGCGGGGGNKPATFLRRPRSADGKLRTPLAIASPSAPPPPKLKAFSEEDYQRARARIFKPISTSAATHDATSLAQDTHVPLVKVGLIAKGPVPGSTGFERRRQCRDAGVSGGAEGETRLSSPSQGRVRQNAGNSPHVSSNDLHDPDFDRRYDKWAVRHAPSPSTQQHHMPVPIFSQLLYQYPVQPSLHHHASVPVRPVPTHMHHAIPQYQSIIQHAPPHLMYQHMSQHSAMHDFSTSTTNPLPSSDPLPFEQHHLPANSTHASFSHLHHAPLQNQVVRKHTPAYGLDSSVDFPPLP